MPNNIKNNSCVGNLKTDKMAKVIIMYKTAVFAERESNRIPTMNSEKIRLRSIVSMFNNGEHVDLFDDVSLVYSVLNVDTK